MKVLVNNKEKIVPVGCTVELLAELIGISKENPVAIALGDEVVEKDLWQSTILQPSDRITIIGATCGG